MATSSPLSSPSLSSNAHFSTQYTNAHLPAKTHVSGVSFTPQQDKTYPASVASTPEVQINGKPRPRPSTSSASTHTHDDMTWGSHFWVTLVDPQASHTLIRLFFYHYGSNQSASPALYRPKSPSLRAHRQDKFRGTLQ